MSESVNENHHQNPNFGERVRYYQDRINSQLATCLPTEETFPTHLHQAMRYSVLGGGKRVRPLLTYACGEALGVELKYLDAPATAVELIHAFSLVHDDLPAMDDDDLRRGQPTTHIAFDEATAILAGDALQALAFAVLADDSFLREMPAVQSRMIRCLAAATGSTGMTGGQAHDLMAEGRQLTLDELQRMHERKTGYLIRAAIMMACEASENLSAETQAAIDQYALHLGLAFQVCDDILDIESTTQILGKPQGSDLKAGKATYPAVLGMEQAKSHLQDLCKKATMALDDLPINTQPLLWVADFITRRDH